MPEHGRDGKTRSRKRTRYSDELMLRCMSILELRRIRCIRLGRERPMKAITLANALGYWPDANHETKRRRVRELVQEMRGQGAPIGSCGGGYYAVETVEDLQVSIAFLRRIGLAPLATTSRLKATAAAARSVGQLRLPAYHAVFDGRSPKDIYFKTTQESDQGWSSSLFEFA